MWKLLIVLLMLSGCGSDDPAPYEVNVHYLPKAEIQAMAVKSNGPLGYEVYGATYRFENSCEIYMISKEEAQEVTFGFLNDDNSVTVLTGTLFYEWLLGHENRHCIDGSFH
jgi:hypothetical protein